MIRLLKLTGHKLMIFFFVVVNFNLFLLFVYVSHAAIFFLINIGGAKAQNVAKYFQTILKDSLGKFEISE